MTKSMEQTTVDKQNCCVILPCRKQEARFLRRHCRELPLEQSQTQTILRHAARTHRLNLRVTGRRACACAQSFTEHHSCVADTIYSLTIKMNWCFLIQRIAKFVPSRPSSSDDVSLRGSVPTRHGAANTCYRGPPSGRDPNM